MVQQISNSIYVALKGDWPAELLAEAGQAIEDFLDKLGHDDCGETELDEDGEAYAYDAETPSAADLEALFGVLEKGPAWIVTVDEADELKLTHYLAGPGLPPRSVVEGPLADPLLPLSKVNDATYLATLHAAKALDGMPFAEVDRG